MMIELRADRTHLYPGARLRLDGPTSSSTVGPARVRLILSDGVEVDAELIEEVDPESGDPEPNGPHPHDGTSAEADALVPEVPGFRTAAGTEVGPWLWSISRIERNDGPTLVVGRRC